MQAKEDLRPPPSSEFPRVSLPLSLCALYACGGAVAFQRARALHDIARSNFCAFSPPCVCCLSLSLSLTPAGSADARTNRISFCFCFAASLPVCLYIYTRRAYEFFRPRTAARVRNPRVVLSFCVHARPPASRQKVYNDVLMAWILQQWRCTRERGRRKSEICG